MGFSKKKHSSCFWKDLQINIFWIYKRNFLQISCFCKTRSHSHWSRFYSLDVHLISPDIQNIRYLRIFACSERCCSLWVMHPKIETRFSNRYYTCEVSQKSWCKRNLHKSSFLGSVRPRSFRAQV